SEDLISVRKCPNSFPSHPEHNKCRHKDSGSGLPVRLDYVLTAHSHPSIAEAPGFEPIVHNFPKLRRWHDNDSLAQASARVLPASVPIGSCSDGSVRPPDLWRPARPGRLVARVGNRQAESIRRKRPTPV